MKRTDAFSVYCGPCRDRYSGVACLEYHIRIETHFSLTRDRPVVSLCPGDRSVVKSLSFNVPERLPIGGRLLRCKAIDAVLLIGRLPVCIGMDSLFNDDNMKKKQQQYGLLRLSRDGPSLSARCGWVSGPGPGAGRASPALQRAAGTVFYKCFYKLFNL